MKMTDSPTILKLNQAPTKREKMAYVPFRGGVGGPRMGLFPVEGSWLEFDEDYKTQTELKSRLLQTEESIVEGVLFPQGPGASLPVSPFLSMTDEICGMIREVFQGTPHQGVLHRFDDESISSHVCAVQDDLTAVQKIDGEWKLIFGAVFFPTAWNLMERIGQTNGQIHTGIGTDKFHKQMSTFLDRLKMGSIYGRLNWFLFPNRRLRHPKENPLAAGDASSWRGITAENAGDRLFLRYERQTFRRLSLRIPTILFTLRVYIDPLRHLKEQPEHIPDFVRAYTTHKYDGPWVEPMMEYLGVNPSTIRFAKESLL